MTGLDSFKTSGEKRQTEGNVEHKQAQAQGYAEGTKDRVTGTLENIKGSLTGDTSQEVSGGCFRFLYLFGNPADNLPMIRGHSQGEGQGSAGCERVLIPPQIPQSCCIVIL